MVFQWRINKYPVEAEVAGEVFNDIEARYGKVDPKVVVEESKDFDAPLHKCFEWDNRKAANKYREGQAKDMITNIIVHTEIDDSLSVPMKAYVSVVDADSGKGKKYISLSVAIENTTYLDQIIANAMKELQSFKRKYQNITQFTTILQEIEKLENNKDLEA